MLVRIWCWIVGHKWLEDPGLYDGEPFTPLYYKGWRPYCERCLKDVDD